MEYTRELVVKKAKQTFPNQNIQYIMESLDLYGQVEHETGRERVHLAILKLCEGDLDKFVKHIHHAKLDQRDIIAAAEYPNQMATTPNLTEEEKNKIIKKDEDQYLKWLNGEKICQAKKKTFWQALKNVINVKI